MPEGDPVYVEPPEGVYHHNDMVWCLKRALNGLRDASRLFYENFAEVLTSRLGSTRSEAQLNLFVDLARTLFIAGHVDDFIMVGSVSSWVIMLDGFLLSAGARTQSMVAPSSCEAEYIAATAATSEAKNIQALFSACGQHASIRLRSDSSGAIGGMQKRSAAPPSSGCAISVATADSRQEGSNQQSARTRERGRRQDQTCRQTFAQVLPIEYGSHRDPATVA